MAQALPTDDPSWAEAPLGGDAGTSEPPGGKIERGFYNDEAPPAGWVNWLFWLFGRWLRYLTFRADTGRAPLSLLLPWTAIASSSGYGPVAFGTRHDVVALGTTLKYSADGGDTWTTTTPAGGATPSHFKAIACNGTVFVMVGTVGKIQTSPCGATPAWTARTAAASFSGDFEDVTWCDTLGKFVAVGLLGEVQTSPEGITWTRRQSALPAVTGYTLERWRRVMHAKGRIVLFGASHDVSLTTFSEFWFSDDSGVTFTRGTPLEISELPTCIGCAAAGVFRDGTVGFVVGMENGLASSADGQTWALSTALYADVSDWLACVFHDGMLVAFASGRGAYSDDALSWHVVPTFGFDPTWIRSSALGYALRDGLQRSPITKFF